MRVTVAVSDNLGPWKYSEVTRSAAATMYVPNLRPALDACATLIERQTLTLLGALFFGYELGFMYHTKMGAGLVPRARKKYAESFALDAAYEADLSVFDSRLAGKYFSLFPYPERVKHLFTEYRRTKMRELIVRFSIEQSGLTNAQLYSIINHANRLCSLLLMIAEYEKAPKSERMLVSLAAGRYHKVFDLERLSVASPGVLYLGVKRAYSVLKKYFPSLRRALSRLPYVDLYVEAEEQRLQADIEGHKVRREAAHLQRDVIRFQHERFVEWQKQLELSAKLKQMEGREEVMEKLLESAEFLQKSKVKIGE